MRQRLAHQHGGAKIVALPIAVITAIALVLTGLATLTAEEPAHVAAGGTLFTRVWTVREGLGPTINARSCAACHSTPAAGGSGTDPRSLVAIASSVIDPTGGHVFRRLRVSPSGAVTEQAMPVIAVVRKPPSLFGAGLIEAIPAAAIAEKADPHDTNGDGVSGRVPGGRFGWKGRFATLEQVVAAAFVNELGLGNFIYPDRSGSPVRPDGIELTAQQLRLVSSFIGALPVSAAQRQDRTEHPGREIFLRTACAACHRPSYKLSNGRTVWPYTDLLLHNVGPALADGMTEGEAAGDEFKTPPLWNVGRTGPPYLHDGRAKSLHDAIVAHSGEAARSAAAYEALSPAHQHALLAFLGIL